MNMQALTQSKYFKVVVVAVGVCTVALVSFASGVAVGFHKARFSYAWGENYERNFVGKARGTMPANRGGMMGRDGFLGKFDERNFRNAHGIAGSVLSVSESGLIIKDKNNQENTVAVTEKTLIKRSRESVKLGDIVKEDSVVVVGSPTESGVINADFIRVFGRESANQ